jgi:GTPase SAR1 family protein
MRPDLTPKKILMLGLDNAGKTSITLTFKKKKNLLSYLSLKPTRKINIDKFSTPEGDISIFDFGGQRKFRENYLNNFKRHLGGVEQVIYVIDVQAIDRYEESLEYFSKIVDYLKQESEAIGLSIFLHKYDPFLTRIEGFENIDSIIQEKLISKIREIIPSEMEYDIFKTCIFASFKKTSI